MNARAYFTILRPMGTVTSAAFCSWLLGFPLLRTLGGAALSETAFFTIVAIASLLLGFFLLAPLHEVMNRNFAAVLPEARNAFRRWHLRTITVTAILLLGATEFCSFEFPLVASLGLILIGLTLPLLNKCIPTPVVFWRRLFLTMTACAFVALPSRALLVEAGRQAPWLFLTAGAACAVFCFQRGFEVDHVRERSRNPRLIYCPQSYSTSSAELQRYKTKDAHRDSSGHSEPTPHEWRETPISDSLWDWIQVIHHTQFGSPINRRAVLMVAIASHIGLGLMLTVFLLLLNGSDTSSTPGFAAFCRQISEAGRIGDPAGALSFLFFGLAAYLAIIVTLALASRLTFFIRPLPLSRRRLTHCVFVEVLRLTGIMTSVLAIELTVLVAIATTIAGQPLSWALFARPAALALLTQTIGLLLWASTVLVSRIRWLPIRTPSLPALVAGLGAGLFVGPLTNHRTQAIATGLLDQVLTPVGLAWLLAATVVTAVLSWLILQRHFRTCDLSRTQTAPA